MFITHCRHFEVERVQVRCLEQYEEIKVPRSAEVGDYDGVHGHGGEKFFPGRIEDCRRGRLFGGTQRRFDVVQLSGRYGGMEAWLLKTQPQPKYVPYQSQHS